MNVAPWIGWPVRPKRKAIPLRVKKSACLRQGLLCARCQREPIHWLPKRGTTFDHEPALRLRDMRRDGSDYIPPQHSAEHIDALCTACHLKKTHGPGATTAGADTGKIKKERKREKERAGIERPKRKIPSRPFRRSKQKMRSRPWERH